MVVPTEAPVCSSSLTEPPDSTIRKARSVSFMRVVMTSSETAAILGTGVEDLGDDVRNGAEDVGDAVENNADNATDNNARNNNNNTTTNTP